MTPRKALKLKRNPNGYKGVQVRKDLRLAIYLRDEFKCSYCNVDLHGADPNDITLDHLKIASKGIAKNGRPDNSPDNLVCACATCNKTRKDSDWKKFAKLHQAQHHINIHRKKDIAPYRALAKAIFSGDVSEIEEDEILDGVPYEVLEIAIAC